MVIIVQDAKKLLTKTSVTINIVNRNKLHFLNTEVSEP